MTGTVLPDDWQPSDSDRIYGLALKFTEQQISEMAEDMKLWAGANANRQIARKANWSMAFKSWMRREAAKSKEKQVYKPKPPAPKGYERLNPMNWKRLFT
jgi:hypothetical protein